jgi:signal transduction histidine kinase/CheY-like chemotaxis protein
VLAVSSAVELYFSYQETKQSIVRLERTKALAAASEIERYLAPIVQHLRATMQGAIDVSALGTAGVGTQAGGQSRAAALAEQREIDFVRLLRSVPAITEVRHLDLAGKERLRTSRLTLDAIDGGQDFADSPEFLGAKARKLYFSPAYFRDEAQPFIKMAVAPDETAAEVTVAEVNIRAIWDVVWRLGTGRIGDAYVVDSNDRLIAHPDLRLVLEKRDLSSAPQVKAARAPRAAAGQEDQAFTIAEGLKGGQVLAVHAAIPALGWLVFIEQPVELTFAPLRAATARSVVVLVLGLLLAALGSVALARRMVAPIRQLQDGAVRVGKGELDHRIDIRSGDELQKLAEEFNHTAAQLQESQRGLEQKVEERTQALASANADITEALEQQMASAEVLRVISSSPTDVQPVFDVIAERAVGLCDGQFCAAFRFDGEWIHVVALSGMTPEGEKAYRQGFPLRAGSGSAIGRAIQTRVVAHIPDVEADADYMQSTIAHAVRFRSIVAVPILRDGRPVGGIAVSSSRPEPFSDARIAMLRSFADQTVIAMENVRLFKEVEARTEALQRSVEELRALGEVGQAVSSTLDMDTVLATIINHAVRLSKADGGGTIYEYNEATGVFEPRANCDVSDELVAIFQESRIRLGETSIGDAVQQRAPVQVADMELAHDNRLRDVLLREGIRAVLAVPLLREDTIVGALVIRKKTTGEFPESVVKLLQTFAAQSVLGIENARLFKEIQEKGRQLEMASQLKSQFLANMSHELRTPLNAIIGVTEMLHEDALDLKREDELEPLERVLRAARHLLALINDILDLSKIEAGKMDIHVESFAIKPLVDDVVQTIGTMAAKSGNKVVVDCAADLGTMRADQTRIRQALLNLASNANKFTERGTVTIAARRGIEAGREWVTLAVADTGIGLTPEQVGKLFQDFVQADASTTRKYGGTGLGLAISRRFCQMMGGDITVASEPGTGSTFTIRLPAEVGAAQPAATAESAARSPQSAGSAAAGATILVIDDDPSVLDLTERFLTREGFSVVTANGGREGLRLARELHPAAITLDVMMPDIDGWTVLAAIKGDPELADIAVVLLTIVDDRHRGFSLGATDYMVKPVDRERLTRLLRKICHAAGAHALLVEDDQLTRRSMRQAIEQDGWKVSEAENGRAALARLADARPDIIVLDLVMPEMDGFEFLVEMRARSEWRSIPVVVVTAKDLTAEERGRLNGDVESVLQKGASDVGELLRELARILPGSIARGRSTKVTVESG